MSDDTRDLAAFGYKQVLDRTLGSFSSFAAGFSYISVLTGIFQTFYLGYGAGGPAFYWTWPAVFLGPGCGRSLFRRAGGSISALRRRLPVVGQAELACGRLDGRLGLPLRVGHQPGGGGTGLAGDASPDRAGVSVHR